MRVIIAAAVVAGLVGCGGHNVVQPRSVADVKRAFARHDIHLVRVQPSVGAPLRYTALFGQSGSLSISVQVYSTLRHPKAHAAHVLGARNVLVEWQGADDPSVEAAVDELR